MSEYPAEEVERDARSVSHWHRHDLQVGRTDVRTGEVEPQESSKTDEKEEIAEPLGSIAIKPEPETETDTEIEPKVFTPEMQPENLSPVERLIWRQSVGYRQGIDKDGHKVGLAFEPGGAAGLISFAEAYELAQEGLLDYVDAIYGLSVGNINALFAATGQWQDGIDVYSKIMPKTFAKWFGLKININALKDAIANDRPLNMEKFKKLKIPVVIGVTQINKFQKIKKKSTDEGMTPEDMVKWSLRGCHIPYLGGDAPADEEGNIYSDAAFGWETTVELAKSDECTDIISLGNFLPMDMDKFSKIKVRGYMAASRVNTLFGDFFLSKHDPNVSKSDAYFASSSMNKGRYYELVSRKHELKRLFREGVSEYNGAKVEAIFPLNPKKISELRLIREKMPGLYVPNARKYMLGRVVAELAAKQVVDSYRYPEKSLERTAVFPNGTVDYSVLGNRKSQHNPIIVVNGLKRGRVSLKEFGELLTQNGERQVVLSDQFQDESGTALITSALDRQAESLLAVLEDSGFGNRPVDFVAHSFGAMVLERAAEIAKSRKMNMTPFDISKGSHSVFIAPAGSYEGRSIFKLKKRYDAHRAQSNETARSGHHPEFDAEAQKYIHSNPRRYRRERLELALKKLPYKKLAKLGLKPVVFLYPQDRLFPQEQVMPIMEKNLEQLSGVASPLVPEGAHDDPLFDPKPTVNSILQAFA